MSKFEVGIFTLADIGENPLTGETPSAKQRMDEIVKAAQLADEAGLDIFGVGEHHRLDYAVSSPAVVLAAIAQATKQIKLTSTTSVLSTLDPIRLFQDFASLDLLSGGRAEILAGRGAFIDSFPLFGYRLDDYNELFEEHMDLLLKANENEVVSWNGRFRPSIEHAEVAPRPYQEKLPIWIGVGGTPDSAARAGRLGVGMALAILGGEPERFQPLVDIYKQAGAQAGHSPDKLKVAVTGHMYIGETTEQAMDEFYPFYSNYWDYVSKQRGSYMHMNRADFEAAAAPNTALFVGSSDQVVEKILRQHELFGHTRFIGQMDIGGQPFDMVAKNIERLATEVVPKLKKYL
ncbi:LLM class flavin-dependent oxidoreductase [Oceanobacillus sp. CAU 1775]